MARRNDVLPAYKTSVGLRLDLSIPTRDRLRVLAAERGYSMSALLRLLVEHAAEHPDRVLKGIPKNPTKQA